ncbi:receptor-type tyrosine-protein phosphatase alpha-like [Ylistrum balloti]|uniref:receptor-type tyrosine-protein phosphatase alpha-like n=1 Tax=Ylistrum balloti TaxID=509963 RepID=UPI002905DB11|nr:receptor-type tyrosine-protein phosphatase alpha-like [Ylistrum balloti]
MDDEPNHTGMITFESVINNCRENVVSRKTLTEHLRMEIARKENCDEFERDFNDFQSGIQFPCEESVKDENMKKNRYTNIIPYDHSRVQLGNRSYINANFIKNLEGTNEYVATQGPKGCTLGDFWQMVWQLKTKKIVMLAKCIEMAKRKVDQYWPDSGDPIEHYNLKLSLTSSNQYAAYTVRELMLENKKTNEKRVVTQFHFKKWPDNDIPDVMHFALFLLHVESVKPSSSGPMIVHCSAGVGRTGVFIASDALYKHGKYTEGVNPAAYIHSMRKDRMDMVQTKPQYIFIYRALLELFLIDKSSLTMGDFKSQYLQSSCLLQDYHMLDDNRPILPNDQIAGGMEPENEKKNRDRKILPGYTHRPLLSSQPGNRTGYINAVFLPSVQNNERYIATQWPLPHTADDFWAMIYDHRSTAVAILDSDADTNDPYLMPSKEEAEITTAHFSIRFKNKPRIENSVVIADMYLSKIGDYDSLQLKIFRMCDWPKSNQTCVSGCVVQMVSAVHRYQLNDTSGGPVTVVCRNGSSKCGIFCAVANAIENISLNRQISLVQVVRQLQLRRPSFINTKTSYLLCNREVDAHFNTMSEYQNLGGPSPQ